MKDVKITVIRKAEYKDLMTLYENPIEHACMMKEGDVFVCSKAEMPEGFCKSAWDSIFPFVNALAYGQSEFYDGWMKKSGTAMISCNDGFRPVSFLLEAIN